METPERTIKDQIDRFCASLLNRGLSQTTVKNYRSDLQGVVRWFSQWKRKQLVWADFFSRDLDEYRQFLSETVKGTTANRKLAGLRAFLKWSAGEQLEGGRSALLPEVRRIISAPGMWGRPRWLNLAEQSMLNQVVRETANPQDRAIITLLLNTGIRTSQLSRLGWGSFNVSREYGRMAIFRPTIGEHVEIPLNSLVREAVLALRYEGNIGSSNLMFKGRFGPMSRRRIEMMVRQYGEKAFIFDLTPLVLRNTFIANMLDSGVNPVVIADILGDPVLDLLRYYARPQEEDLESAVEKIALALQYQEHKRPQDKPQIPLSDPSDQTP